jgi:DNA-directed RNA polymerase subunit RPC12/RpoP
MEPQRKCQKCGSEAVIGVEYYLLHPEHYDGVSEWRCEDCGVRIGRWSGKELADGESEKRYGGA